MRKVFLDKLPIHTNTANHGRIDWIKSIGQKISFVYDDTIGELEIIDYKKPHLYIKYLDNDLYKISTTNLASSPAKIGMLICKLTNKYKYSLNEIVPTNNSDIKILEHIRMKQGKKTTKGYKYKCLTCGFVGEISETNLNIPSGCSSCRGFSIKIGFNDMWTTNLELAKLLNKPEDGYKYTKNSNAKVEWKCPTCKTIIYKQISDVNNNGIRCPKCCDGISFPEKVMYSVLQQLDIQFNVQVTKTTFDWCKNIRYDFYIPEHNTIVETHGIQHYEHTGLTDLKYVEENDKIKEKLAFDNNINDYIVIDCRKSEINYIKNSILNSNLSKIYNLNNINWGECEKTAYNSLIYKACNLWNDGIKDTSEISKILKLSRGTIIKYLKKGSNIGLCNYVAIMGGRMYSKKIICTTTLEVFDAIIDVKKVYKVDGSCISKCCKKRESYMHAGIHPKTSEKLSWMYYEDWLQQQETIDTNQKI